MALHLPKGGGVLTTWWQSHEDSLPSPEDRWWFPLHAAVLWLIHPNRPISISSNNIFPSLLVSLLYRKEKEDKDKRWQSSPTIIQASRSSIFPTHSVATITATNNDRDAEAASTSYEDDTFSISSEGEGGGKSWRFWNSINRMNIFMMLFVVILLGLTASLSTTAVKSSNVVANMSSTTKAPKASKVPTTKSTKKKKTTTKKGSYYR